MRIQFNAGLAVLAMAFVAWTPANGQTVDQKAVIQRGTDSLAKLSTTPASWEITDSLLSGAVVHVSILRAHGMQRTIYTLINGGQSTEVYRIISRDGEWYVTDRTGFHKCRPYEALADSPIIYLILERSDPMFVNDPRFFSGSTLENINGNVATYRQPIPAATLGVMQGTLDQMNAFALQSGQTLSPDLQNTMNMLKDSIAHGLATRIDLSTGQAIEFGNQKMRTHFDGFQFLPHVNDSEFEVADHQWIDDSDDPTLGDLDDLMMIGNAPTVQPGDKNYDLSGGLLDVKTGRFRRLPFVGGVAIPGCFLKDRRTVIVCGLNGDTGSLRPYRIDLSTRKCQAIGGSAFDSGFTLGGDLSPDGNTVALIHIDPSRASILQSQVYLIDLRDGSAKALGKPIDTAGANWCADGNHLVMVDRKMGDLNAPAVGWIAVMDMTGQVADIKKGNLPVMLADRKTILYQDDDTSLWHTCDLNGGNDKLYGDGLTAYGFPAPAPDGQRVLFMHFAPGALPDRVVMQLGQSQGTEIQQGEGLWGMPKWR
jgi:hypothetical protein